MSLAQVARRAGTSAATLSRYENGWTRFETYTLGKLAGALGCEVRIALRPRATVRGRPSPDRASMVRRLRRLFWDCRLCAADLDERRSWVLERVLEYGSLEDVLGLQRLMGRQEFLLTAARAYRVSPKTRNFWRRLLELEGIACTAAYSRDTAWNS
jgi:transcriptional regulator with XRE-family HTH domain